MTNRCPLMIKLKLTVGVALLLAAYSSEAYSTGLHFHHGSEHDVLHTKLANYAQIDADLDAQ